MGDYTPVHDGGMPLTLTASVAVTGGQPVEITGDLQVGPAAALSQKVIGVAGHDCPAGSKLTVHCPAGSVHEVAVSVAIVAGDHVAAAGGGQVRKYTVGTDAEPARLGLCIKGQATIGSVCQFFTA